MTNWGDVVLVYTRDSLSRLLCPQEHIGQYLETFAVVPAEGLLLASSG